MSESGDAWHERQKRSQEAADRFERELSKAGAHLIIEFVTFDLMAEIDKAAPERVDLWCGFFRQMDQNALNNLYNVVSTVAAVVARRNAAAGLSLFELLKAHVPHVRVTYSPSSIGLDAITAWHAADNPDIRDLCFARLDRIGNDHDLSMEVLAAIRADRIGIVRDYVLDRRERPEPAHRARAAMVAGLSPDADWARETVYILEGERGFLGEAFKGAKYAFERHQWSRHWAAQMRDATDPIDLWRCSLLLSKIVDGRFSASEVEGDQPSPLIKRFGPMLVDPIRQRINNWKGKRESKLFGMSAPSAALLPGHDV
jgi:hypothetical protein